MFAQHKVQIIDKETNSPLPNVEVNDLDYNLIAISNQNGFVTIPEQIKEIYIDSPGFPPQRFQLPIEGNKLYLKMNMVSLQTITVVANDEKSLNLIRKVIEKQKENSPTALPNYEMNAYTKFWVDAQQDSIVYIENPKTPEDSAQNDNKKLLEESMLFISERAMKFYYDKRYGKKNIVEAARISGLKTPLYEFIALQPVTYEFNQNDFNFFFRKFPNPLSRQGMKAYNFIIQDTISKKGRSTAEVTFRNKKDEKISLHGTLLIDLENYALANFYAENQTQSGSDTYIEVAYEPVKSVWIPDFQYFRLESNTSNSHYYQDSITPNGEVVSKKMKRKMPSWLNTHTTFSDFTSPVELDKKLFKGYENEVPKTAFKEFERRIATFRKDSLTQREIQTYVKIDSVGKAEKVDRSIKLLRFITQDGWVSLGKVDLDVKDVVAYNNYEKFRLGLSLRTNHTLHPKLSLNGSAYYGTGDKDFKYGFGANYVINPAVQGKVFADYQHDISPMGRFANPNRYFKELMDRRSELYTFQDYYQNNKFSFGYQQDFFENVTTRFTISSAKQKALFDYTFQTKPQDFIYDETMAQIAVRFAPKEKYLAAPMGKFKIQGGYPIFRFTIDKGFDGLGGNQDFTRIYTNNDFAVSLFSKPTMLNIRAGKIFGDVPIWQYFEGGGKSRNKEKILDRFTIGGSQAFETMIPGEFMSSQFVQMHIKQPFFRIKTGKKDYVPVNLIYGAAYGTMDNAELHPNFQFKEMKDIYQEAGIEFHNLALNFLGLGFYYRLGAYNLGAFDKDFSVKVVFNFNGF